MENEKTMTKRRFTKEELLALAMEDAIAISDRFAREPILARTGKGYYKSVGVEGLKQDIEYLKSIESHEASRRKTRGVAH